MATDLLNHAAELATHYPCIASALREVSEPTLKALRALAALPIEDMAADIEGDDSIIYMIGQHKLCIGHVRDARAALEGLTRS